MPENLPQSAVTATPSNGIGVSDGPDTEAWFAAFVRALLGPKAGTQLHFITGIDERSCQRYAAGTVKPPLAVLLALLRSEHGAAILCHLMGNSTAAWWADLREDQRQAAILRAAATELNNRPTTKTADHNGGGA